MKHILLSLLLLFALGGVARAQKCDCTKIPFKPEPECFNTCAVGLLQRLDSWELQVVFNLSKDSAENVVHANLENSPNFQEYGSVLSEEELSTIRKKIESLTPNQLKYLDQPLEKRKALRSEKRFQEMFAVTDKMMTQRPG
jgi:hypothetical protein